MFLVIPISCALVIRIVFFAICVLLYAHNALRHSAGNSIMQQLKVNMAAKKVYKKIYSHEKTCLYCNS